MDRKLVVLQIHRRREVLNMGGGGKVQNIEGGGGARGPNFSLAVS